MRLFEDLIDSLSKGGPGSGHRGHKGIPGQRGGSAPASGAPSADPSVPASRKGMRGGSLPKPLPKDYKSLDDAAKADALRASISSYPERYVKVGSYSDAQKANADFVKLNKSVGAYEARSRAMAAKAVGSDKNGSWPFAFRAWVYPKRLRLSG